MSFAINPRKDLTREVRRVAARELTRMENEFGARGEAAHRGVHDARKRIKRLRGLYGFIRAGAKLFARRENDRLRDIARSLSTVRDATALVETADKLVTRFPDPVDAGILARLRGVLIERRDRIAQSEVDLDAHLEAAVDACRCAKKALGTLKLPTSRSGARELLIGSLKHSYRDVQRGFGKAKAGGAAEDWHDLRKLVKHHLMQVMLMRAARPKAMKKRAGALDRLGELLGDDHDLSVLVAVLGDIPAVAATDRERIAALARTRTGELRYTATAALETLFSARPERFAGRIAKHWRAPQKAK